MTRLRQRRNISVILHDLPVRTLQTHAERQTLCDYIGYSTHPDLRMQYWDIQPLPHDEFIVTGYVSNPFTLKALQKAAEECRTTCDISQVKTLPLSEMSRYPFGIVTSTDCPIVDAEKQSEQLDAAVYGRILVLLKQEETSSIVQSPNGYIGWADNSHFRPITTEEWYAKLRADHALFLSDYHNNGVTIPQGSELPVSSNHELILPTGSLIPIANDDHRFIISKNNEQRDALMAITKTLIGTPYVWGGVSKRGIDCSGFTRYAYHSIGISLPRDADQQFLTGRICGLPGMMDGIRSGDLLFFTGNYGGISHIALAIDSNTFIHASTKPGVVITTWDKEPSLFEKFIMAKRILR